MDSLLGAAQLEDAPAGAPVYFPVNPMAYHGPHPSLLSVSAGLAGALVKALGRWPFILAGEPSIGIDTMLDGEARSVRPTMPWLHRPSLGGRVGSSTHAALEIA